MFQFKKQVKETKEQVLQTEEKLNLHPLIHVSDSLLDYHKKLSNSVRFDSSRIRIAICSQGSYGGS